MTLLVAGCMACAGEQIELDLTLQASQSLASLCSSPGLPAAPSMAGMLVAGDRLEGLAVACVGSGTATVALAGEHGAEFESVAWYTMNLPPRPRATGTAGHLALAAAGTGTAVGVMADGSPSSPSSPRSVTLPAGSTVLAHDGSWLLARTGWSGLELVDLDQPANRFPYQSSRPRHVLGAVAVAGGFLVFTGGIAGEFPAWIAIRLGATPTFELVVENRLGEVFDAFVAGDDLILASWSDPGDRGRVRVIRLALEDGRPVWPQLAMLELPLQHLDGPAYLAWDGEGTGFVAQLEWRSGVCAYSSAFECRLATGPVGYVLRADGSGLSAKPLLLPYLEYEPVVLDPVNRPVPVLAARGGKLLALQGPPYVVATYAVDPR